MVTIDFDIRDAETALDRDVVRQLLRDGFDVRPGVGDVFAALFDQVLTTPVWSRVAVAKGRVVGHALLAKRTFVIDGVPIMGGIVAMVVVDRAHRQQGIGSALVQDVVALARVQGMMMLHLAGDPAYYSQFGFVSAYIEAQVEMAIAGGEGDPLRLGGVSDVPLLAQLSACDAPSGAVYADESRWHWVMTTGHPASLLRCHDQFLGFYAQGDACLLLGEVGFVRVGWQKQQLAVYEAGAVSDAAARQMVGAVMHWGQRQKCDRLSVFLPPQNRFVTALAQSGALITIRQDYELQAQILDVYGVLQAMADVFCKRLTHWTEAGVLGLCVGKAFVRLDIGSGQVVIRQVDELALQQVNWLLALSEAGLTRAVLGTDGLHDPEGDQKLDAILSLLFPRQDPFFWLADSI